MYSTLSFIITIIILISFNLNAQGHIYLQSNFVKAEHLIPMRDGVKLYTQVYIPKDTSLSYPIIFERTPYSTGDYGPEINRDVLGPNPRYAYEKFIFVYQDIRGTSKSGGEFDVMRPYIPNKRTNDQIDESSDTYDTIEWLIKNIPHNNGKVLQWGTSYSGWLAVMGIIDAHPSLVASLPQAPPADMWIGDDFHHNGAFRLMYSFSWLLNYDSRIKSEDKNLFDSFDFKTNDGYEFFRNLGTLKNVNKKYFKYSSPTWNDFMLHGDYDKYWQSRNLLPHLKNIYHPILIVAGWFDAEDFYGPLNVYKTIEENCPKNKTTLIIGPWKHSGWNWMDGDRLGYIEFGDATGEFFREEIEFPFFLQHLKDKELFEYPEVIAFETGTNVWKNFDSWPPRRITEKKIYFHNNGKLSFNLPVHNSENYSISYVSDPMNPIPWSTEVRTTQGHLWMIEDQRFVAKRPDVLVFQSDVLEEDITIAGPIEVKLFVSITGTDADWIVKLIDVFPNYEVGDKKNKEELNLSVYQMLLAGEVFRSKYRNSYENPEPMVPGKITEIEFNLGDRLHCFKKSHSIMVQIQSSWFPVIDMNPQMFVNIYNADEENFQEAVHTVYYSREYPTQIQFNVLE